ncbi:hypothetical protein [Methylobacterium sp. NEAU K]|uniref:hypothetical protein n=1 Tax=Methylobacterium sp. NEAU K TaxID=3064946 RepID=UPI002735ED82|nr:hypothetical protein [Methylobacterium sp. NEAU K]MDP4006140.1 hypothetical protein [Methylobacterium sp. NEAU K]
MDKTVAGLIGAVTLLAVADPAQAAMPAPAGLDTVMQVASYADLLKPIPNAAALLKTSEEAEARAELLPTAAEGDATVQQAQYYHHHHHHHHGYFRRFHHHHHHHGYFRRFHHHHHHGYFRRDGF